MKSRLPNFESRCKVNSFRLPDETHVGYVHLQVSDLQQSLAFYRDLIGFQQAGRNGATVFLSSTGISPFHIMLTEHRDAKPRPRSSTGLFHVAIRFPNRKELARIFKRLYEHRWAFQGFADHGVSEALYLADPDGNGIELYADRPREQWPIRNGELYMVTDELDVQNLLDTLKDDPTPWTRIHPEAQIGHIHLQVSDLGKAERFYHEILGFDVTQRSYPGALFVSAGGYHHHIGLNIWNSRGASPPPPDAIGLVRFGIEVPNGYALESVKERLRSFGIEIEKKNNGSGEKQSFLARDFDGIKIEIVAKNT